MTALLCEQDQKLFVKNHAIMLEPICSPCKEAVSSDQHAGDLTLRLCKMIVNWDLEQSKQTIQTKQVLQTR